METGDKGEGADGRSVEGKVQDECVAPANAEVGHLPFSTLALTHLLFTMRVPSFSLPSPSPRQGASTAANTLTTLHSRSILGTQMML